MALLVLIAVFTTSVLAELRPAGAPTQPLVIVSRPVAPGAAITGADITVADFPSQFAPPQAITDVEEVVGRTAAAVLAVGMPITPGLLVGPGLTAAAPEGTVAAPVRLSDVEMATLLRPGDRVDLLHAGSGEARVVARRAVVLSPVTEANDGGLLGLKSGGGLVLVAVSEAEATAIAGAGAFGAVSVVLVP